MFQKTSNNVYKRVLKIDQARRLVWNVDNTARLAMKI